MRDRYGHEWPDTYDRGFHTSEENLQRANAYVQNILSQEEYYRVITPTEAAAARYRNTEAVDEGRSVRPARREYHFSDRTNRPEKT